MNDIHKYQLLFRNHWVNISEDEIIKIVSNMDALVCLFFQKYLSNPPQYGNEKQSQNSSDVLQSFNKETDERLRKPWGTRTSM